MYHKKSRMKRLLSGALAGMMVLGSFVGAMPVYAADDTAPEKVTVTLEDSDYGTLAFGDSPETSLEVEAGTKVSVKATPKKEGWSVSSIQMTGESDPYTPTTTEGDSAEFTVTESAVISASYTNQVIDMDQPTSANARERWSSHKGYIKADEAFGGKAGAHLRELKAHEHDNVYLGTPYYEDFDFPWLSMRPGLGMNCTGFVASVMQTSGSDLSPLDNFYPSYRPQGYHGGKVNASNWFHWMQDNGVEYYKFDGADPIRDLLASGLAEKGDILYFNPTVWSNDRMSVPGTRDVDCHMGFFWGDHSGDDKIWHSLYDGNEISNIHTKGGESVLYLFKSTHDAKFSIQKQVDTSMCENTALWLDNNNAFSLKDAVYGVYEAGTDKLLTEITTNADGVGETKDALPVGTNVDIKEIKAPKGYTLNTGKINVTVESGMETIKDEMKAIAEKPKMDPIQDFFKVYENRNGTNVNQGNVNAKEIKFRIDYYKTVDTSGNIPDARYKTVTVDVPIRINGQTGSFSLHDAQDWPFKNKFGLNTIPPGTVVVTELVPNGIDPHYTKPLVYTWNEAKGGYNNPSNLIQGTDSKYKNKTYKGRVSVTKIDNDYGNNVPQGDADLSGIEYTIYNISDNIVTVNPEAPDGQKTEVTAQTAKAGYYALNANEKQSWRKVYDTVKNAKVTTCTTKKEANGHYTAASLELPYGTYVIMETGSNNSYHMPDEANRWFRVFSITENKDVSFTSSNSAKNPVNRTMYQGQTYSPGIRSLTRYTRPPHQILSLHCLIYSF